jgi:hypothetical protein
MPIGFGQMGFFNRRGSPPGGTFETTDRVPLEERDEEKAKRSTRTRNPQDVQPGLHVFRASNNQTFRDAALRHNLALERGYYSEFTQIDRRNWHVFVSEATPVQVDPFAGVSDASPGSTQWLLDVANYQKAQQEETPDDDA